MRIDQRKFVQVIYMLVSLKSWGFWCNREMKWANALGVQRDCFNSGNWSWVWGRKVWQGKQNKGRWQKPILHRLQRTQNHIPWAMFFKLGEKLALFPSPILPYLQRYILCLCTSNVLIHLVILCFSSPIDCEILEGFWN